MHILLNLTSMLGIVLLASVLAFRLQQHFEDWSRRRGMQLCILAMPLFSFLVVIGALVHVIAQRCILNAPLWDHTLDIATFLLLSLIVFGAISLGGLRLLLMKWLMRRKEVIVDPALQNRVDAWAVRRGICPVRVRLCLDARPLALLYGMRQPTVLLSTWMLEHLDEAELEAVLVHELEHASRRDYVVNWIATILRDAFFYLPTSKRAYRQFCQEKELACDDRVVLTTQRPLALASALVKVWLHLVEQPHVPHSPLAQALVGNDEHITSRVDRLLLCQPTGIDRVPARWSLGMRLSVIGIPCFVVAVSLLLMLAEIWCWPGAFVL